MKQHVNIIHLCELIHHPQIKIALFAGKPHLILNYGALRIRVSESPDHIFIFHVTHSNYEANCDACVRTAGVLTGRLVIRSVTEMRVKGCFPDSPPGNYSFSQNTFPALPFNWLV